MSARIAKILQQDFWHAVAWPPCCGVVHAKYHRTGVWSGIKAVIYTHIQTYGTAYHDIYGFSYW